jgi:ParB family chromosome partitioning protein
MRLIKVDPRALKDNPDRLRQTKSTPQADALLLATIKAVGIAAAHHHARGRWRQRLRHQCRAPPREAGDRGRPQGNRRARR